jgi:predicted RNA binding protein YcfA (HicA-like mRNA interferase family)
MKTVSGKKFCKVLTQRGWVLDRTSGSHFIYKKPDQPGAISVPVHGNDDLKRGILSALLKQAGLTEADL